ncbi:MAG: glycosyltransferase [Desulfuromusa sp.]|nr:glycosyltransferase [Desulfuromusa sp.]
MNRSETTGSNGDWIEVSDTARLPSIPLVSVQMLAYNHGSYIAEAIEGVVSQIVDFPIELIIGEDCSDDTTREIVFSYQKRFPHMIRVLYSNHNVGFMENYRRVLLASNGEFIAACEGDDFWVSKTKLAQQIAILSKNQSVDISIHPKYAG